MELVTENLDGVIVLNISNVCTSTSTDCRECTDVGGAVHNWLMVTGLRYVIVDFQDEKDICPTFIIELLQLRKRHRIPFLFSGVMSRPKGHLEAYDYSSTGTPIFFSPEEAIEYMRDRFKQLLNVDLNLVKIGQPIETLRARQIIKADTEEYDLDL